MNEIKFTRINNSIFEIEIITPYYNNKLQVHKSILEFNNISVLILPLPLKQIHIEQEIIKEPPTAGKEKTWKEF